MKKNYKLFLTAVVASVASISAIAQSVSTLTFTKGCGGSGTADDGAVWTVTSDAEESVFDSNSGVHYGTGSKEVTYVQLSTSSITDAVSQVVVNARDAQEKATISVTVGGTAFTCSGAATAKNTSADYTFTGNGTGEIVVRVARANSMKKAIYVKSVAVTHGSGVVVSVPSILAESETFEESTTVTITADEGAAIYYTTDGTTPTAESTAYTAAFDVTATTTVKAIAVKNGKSSSVASLALTKLNVTSMTFAEAYDWCIAQDYTKTTKHEGYVKITFDNAKVLYADETAIYVRQGENAMQFYGFPFSEKAVVANDVLNGTYAGQLQAYKGIPELSASTNITTAANVTVTNSEDVAAAISATVAEVEARTYICDLVELTNVTITKDGDYFWLNSGDNDVEVKVTNNLIPAEYTNKLYNVTAVVTATYKNEGVLTLLSCEYVSEVPTEPGVVTAVEGVNANKLDANAPIYNLQGQLVDKNAKGILIQNGKKIVVK